MHALQISHDDLAIAEALDTLELELALQVQDVSVVGFETALAQALAGLKGELLFRMPGDILPDAREIAAVSVPDEEAARRKVLLVVLAHDGTTMRVQDAGDVDHAVGSLARSMAGVIDSFSASEQADEHPILL
ncbi:hypothetical protein [Tianweitania sediminis]|jgi:hypothetical protein|uniref:Uncharacterized protein n=1 Tax=Tianweitania sediminis TaxID=1502156 RepID=A0A8J7UJG0_9HYPH|nr:hypothetical protein [Tianweitania sediminis]MBP0438825.1 hypothetical protein [Tianweitania sediminis]HEV7416160.1 hypothetical protein [Tianweitania sediminis]